MKTNYTIKNFRAFDRKGAQIEISPLTYLVGCNSSGKSSIVKSLFLLKEFFGLKTPIMESTIDFSKYPINTLGTFGNAVHSSSKDKRITLKDKNKDKIITLSYERRSVYLNDIVTVSFSIREEALGNGYVSKIEIKKQDDTILFDVSNVFFMATDTLKKSFKAFLAAARYNHIRPLKEVFNTGTEQKDLMRILEKLKQNALQYSSEDFLDDVYNLKEIPSFENEGLAIGKFLETGILMYFSVLDELKDVNAPDMIRTILRSKVIDNSQLNDDKRSILFSYIDAVCHDYSQSHKKDFISYYKSLEDEFINYDAPRFLELVNNSDYSRSDYSDLFQISPEFVSGEIEGVDYGFPRERKSGVSFFDIFDRFGSVHGLLAYFSPENPYSSHKSKPGETETARHPFYLGTFKDYIDVLLKDILCIDITESLDYISSSRIQVRRLYPMDDDTEFVNSVKKYYDIKSKFKSLGSPITVYVGYDPRDPFDSLSRGPIKVSDFVPGSFMNKWIKAFNIGDRISLEMDQNGLGLLLKVFNSPSDKKGRLIADMGYGITQFLSIVLQIETSIMSNLYDCVKGKTTTVNDVRTADRIPDISARTIAIEEPEIHLHPKYQSLLAEMFYEAYKEYNIQFIIETHSEYLLRKVQTLVGAKNLSPEEVSMIYVEDDEEVKKGSQKVRRIPVKEDGRLAAPFGPGFYDEAGTLSRELLKKAIEQKEG